MIVSNECKLVSVILPSITIYAQASVHVRIDQGLPHWRLAGNLSGLMRAIIYISEES